MGVRRNFSRVGATSTFCYLFQVADVTIQTDVCKTRYCFYTTKAMPHENTRSIRIYFEIFFKWSCIGLRICHKGVAYFLSSFSDFAELSHIHTTESEMDLNYQQMRLWFSH